jgi:hypothetical protein
MAGLLDRVSQIVRAEWNSWQEGAEHDDKEPGPPTVASHKGARARRVQGVPAALRVLELPASARLDEIRAAYRRLAMHAHAAGNRSDAARAAAASGLLQSLTDAVEILEEDRLPLPGLSVPAADAVEPPG